MRSVAEDDELLAFGDPSREASATQKRPLDCLVDEMDDLFEPKYRCEHSINTRNRYGRDGLLGVPVFEVPPHVFNGVLRVPGVGITVVYMR